jgi:hypothetical protein
MQLFKTIQGTYLSNFIGHNFFSFHQGASLYIIRCQLIYWSYLLKTIESSHYNYLINYKSFFHA